jgi:hypothetical protein
MNPSMMTSPFKITVVTDGLIVQTDDEVYRVTMDKDEMMKLSTEILLMLTQKMRDKSNMNGSGNVAG